MEPTELAYAAGYIDGEGCLTLLAQEQNSRTRRLSLRPILIVSGTDERALLHLQQLFGGRRHTQFRAAPQRPCHFWSLVGDELGTCLLAIRPYLWVKGEQAGLLLRMLELRRGRTGPRTPDEEQQALRLQIYEQIRRLNQRGTRTRATSS